MTEIPLFFVDLTSLKKLDVSGNQISIVPQSLVSLKNLEDLNISFNKISEIPPFIDSLEKLRILNCSNNILDRLPKALMDMKIIGLNLSGNKFDNFPTPVPQMSLLSNLDLSDNKIPSIPESCRSLFNLQILDLHSNQIDSIPSKVFEKMCKLTSININNNPLNSIPDLNVISHLKEFTASYVSGSCNDTFPDIFNVTEMERIELFHTPIRQFPSLLTLTKMTSLILHHNNITSIKDIPRKCSLDVSNNKIEEITVQRYVELPQLILSHNNLKNTPDLTPCETVQSLDLSYNGISSIKDYTFHTSVQQLILNGNPLRVIPTGITQCTNLTLLSLANCELFDFSVNIIHSLCNIKSLDISNNRFISYEHFDSFIKLEVLIASSNNIGAFPKEFLSMKSLKKIVMNNNRIKVIPNEIKDLRALEIIDLSCNQLHSFNPLELNKNLIRIDLSFNYVTESANVSQWDQLEELNLIGNPLYDTSNLIQYSKRVKLLSSTFVIQRINQETLEISGTLDEKSFKKLPETINNANEFKTKKIPSKSLKINREEFKFDTDCHGEIGISLMKGNKKYMHNTVCVGRNIFGDGLIIGSFDGHLGDGTAKLCSSKFIEIFLSKIGARVEEGSIQEALNSSFEKLNSMVKELELNDGTSAIAYMWFRKMIYVANCGNIQCFIVSKNGIEQIKSHNTLSSEETKTKIARREFIDGSNKLEDVFEVGKSIGYYKYEQFLSCIPDFTKIEQKDEHQFILSISKGIYDVIEMNELFGLIKKCHHIQPDCIACLIRDLAYQRSAKGNLTVTLLSLEALAERSYRGK